jgi:GDP-L-fucose synthase
MKASDNERTLITGAGGMVGGSIADLARNAGWQVFTPSSKDLDLRDSKATLDFLLDYKIDSVIHCAARVGGIAANVAAPADFILDNLQIDASLASTARRLRVKNFLYFGSSCMYPKTTLQPMQINQILTSSLEPTNEGYALSKISGAKTVSAIAQQDSLNWRVLIPSNLYGPRDNFDPLTSHLIPAVIHKIHSAIESNQELIEIWGDGQARREFTFVGDLAEFVVLNFYKIRTWPEMLNVGYGSDYSVNEYYRAIAEELRFTGKFDHNLEKPVGMKQKLMDSSVARLYGWNPTTDLKAGIKKTIEWFMENLTNE